MHRPGERIIDGKRLETLWLPPAHPERPTIVMLHEGLGSVAMWKDFPHRIADRTGCGVFVYSRYGHGGSDRLAEKRPVRYMHHEAEIVLPSLLAQAGIERPILLGHSDGASIALIHAGSYPDSPRGLILEAPHVFVEDLSVKSIAEAKAAYLTTDLPRKLGRYHQHVDATFWGWNDIWLDPLFRTWNIESSLDAIRCPVLVIQGEDDEYGTIRQVGAIQARIPCTQVLLLARCGHSPHRDQPEATLDRAADFVAALQRTAPSEAREFPVPVESRYFEDYIPGNVYEYGTITVTEPEIIEFAKQFDPQPMHIDREQAAQSRFGEIVASGWHTVGLAMRLYVDQYLSHVASLASPGVDELRWPHPLRPGDSLRIRVSILEARPSRSKPDRGVVRALLEALNQENQIVLSVVVMSILRRREVIS